jgi:prepilin-type N-terminal cleavage/methylation domain-containing protein
MVSERIRRLDDRGWTLAELLVVIAVIAIVTAVSAPLFVSYMQGATVRAGAQELRTALNGAKQLAITLRQSICLQPTGGSAYQFRKATCAGAVVSATEAPGADATGTFRLQNSVVLTVNTAPVFSPLGGAAPAGIFTVTGSTGNSLTVTVSSAGRITTP